MPPVDLWPTAKGHHVATVRLTQSIDGYPIGFRVDNLLNVIYQQADFAHFQLTFEN
nr:hypothetical protein [Mycobacterium persicum]